MLSKFLHVSSMLRFQGLLSNVLPHRPFLALKFPELQQHNHRQASVCAGFPSSQTFLDIKVMETKMTIAKGAGEIDIVLNLGNFLAGDYAAVIQEISMLKRACGEVHLKVILETGALKTHAKIWKASLLAMQAGADFIKTSTGKLEPAVWQTIC